MTTGGMPDATVKKFRADLLAAHNAMRSKYGHAKALIIGTDRQTEAQYHSDRMARTRTLFHGDYGKSHGQNVGGAYSTVAGVMNAWRQSCGHFYNIVAKQYTKVGFGISKDSNGGLWFTANFGGSSFDFCSKCPGCSCSGGVCQTSGHAFYSNDPWKP